MSKSGEKVVCNGTPMDKKELYGWKDLDKPGEFYQIPKGDLYVDRAGEDGSGYQRDEVGDGVINAIARDFSWAACGALIVSARADGYWVMDGQQRLTAARKRSDITEMPCIVFDFRKTHADPVAAEADAFMLINSKRAAVHALDKYRAGKRGTDETAHIVSEILKSLGLEVRRDGRDNDPKTVTCISRCIALAKISADDLTVALETASLISRTNAIGIVLLSGLFHIHRNIKPLGLREKWLLNRLAMIGPVKLVNAAMDSARFFGKGTARNWAFGMLKECCKGTQKNIEI